jgi:hypothetical protein
MKPCSRWDSCYHLHALDSVAPFARCRSAALASPGVHIIRYSRSCNLHHGNTHTFTQLWAACRRSCSADATSKPHERVVMSCVRMWPSHTREHVWVHSQFARGFVFISWWSLCEGSCPFVLRHARALTRMLTTRTHTRTNARTHARTTSTGCVRTRS